MMNEIPSMIKAVESKQLSTDLKKELNIDDPNNSQTIIEENIIEDTTGND